jgi:hypothetical protein
MLNRSAQASCVRSWSYRRYSNCLSSSESSDRARCTSTFDGTVSNSEDQAPWNSEVDIWSTSGSLYRPSFLRASLRAIVTIHGTGSDGLAQRARLRHARSSASCATSWASASERR